MEFPFVLEKRNGRATIYRGERRKGAAVYEEFRVAIYESDGKRKLRTFSSFDEAHTYARTRLESLNRGVADVVTLTGNTRLDYLEARRLLPQLVSLTDAAKAWLERDAKPKATAIRVPDLVEAFATARKAATRHGRRASPEYARDIDRRLGRFAESFQVDVASVTPALVEAWLDETEQTGRNRFNTLRLLRTLFRWAQKRGNLPEGKVAPDAIDFAVTGDSTRVEIFTPEELARLLAAAREEMVPYLALGAFAGCRTAETGRLDWPDLKFERGFIEVGAEKAKTASRRLVPILPALASWLAPIRKPAGNVLPFANVAKQVVQLAKDAGVKWKHNALRHSFISYRLAEIQSVDKVALEAGNSPNMIFKHYRELVTPEQAQAWFSVLPKTAGTVVSMPAAQTAQEATG